MSKIFKKINLRHIQSVKSIETLETMQSTPSQKIEPTTERKLIKKVYSYRSSINSKKKSKYVLRSQIKNVYTRGTLMVKSWTAAQSLKQKKAQKNQINGDLTNQMNIKTSRLTGLAKKRKSTKRRSKSKVQSSIYSTNMFRRQRSKKSKYYSRNFKQDAKSQWGKRKMVEKSANTNFDHKLKNFKQRQRPRLINDDFQNRIGWGFQNKNKEILDPDYEEPNF